MTTPVDKLRTFVDSVDRTRAEDRTALATMTTPELITALAMVLGEEGIVAMPKETVTGLLAEIGEVIPQALVPLAELQDAPQDVVVFHRRHAVIILGEALAVRFKKEAGT